MKYNPRDENSIKAVMAKANVVINLIGTCLLSLFGWIPYIDVGEAFFVEIAKWVGLV